MAPVDFLDQAIELAQSLGYNIRYEYLGGASSGFCEFGGKRWIFVDVALNSLEQIDQIGTVLSSDPAIHLVEVPEKRAEHWHMHAA